MRILRKAALAAAVAALCLALGGCGSQAASSSAGSAGSADGSSQAAASASAEAASAGFESAAAAAGDSGLAPGTYTASFNTDSNMFHVNEANEGKGELTVTDEGMVIHVSLVSTKIVNLYAGTADEAQAEGTELLEPTTDEVTYSDGTTEEVYGFDVPVPALDQEFDVAILGESGRWFDHKVSVSDVEPAQGA